MGKVVSLILDLFKAGCTKSQNNIMVGGLYAIASDKDRYQIIKVLIVDDVGVHIMMYSNNFENIPNDIGESDLFLGNIKDHTENIGVGHMPLLKKSFIESKPKLIKIVAVGDMELEGYKIWKESKGGYFNIRLNSYSA